MLGMLLLGETVAPLFSHAFSLTGLCSHPMPPLAPCPNYRTCRPCECASADVDVAMPRLHCAQSLQGQAETALACPEPAPAACTWVPTHACDVPQRTPLVSSSHPPSSMS